VIKPRWRALGWAQIGMVSTILAYYNVLLAYSCLYIIASCITPLPWEEKGSEAYWSNDILNEQSEGNEQMGTIQWELALSLLFIYILVFFCVSFGSKVLTDVTWVTVCGPILLMIILFCRTVGLPGASDGIEFYLGKFEWEELYNAELWAVACGQIIFSLSPGCGTAIALSSVVSPKEDVYRVCYFVSLCNSSFSLFGGFAIFSILGNLAHETGQSVSVVASESGTGLAFISIAQGITHFGSAANVMSVLFFVMLLSLGLDSTFAWLETLIAVVHDISRSYNYKMSHAQVVGTLCILLFFMGLPFITRGGNGLLDVIDHFVGAYFLLFSCGFESICFQLDFGWDRFVAVIHQATKGNPRTPTGRRIFPELFWKIRVCYIVPVATFGLLFSEFYHDVAVEMYGDGDYSPALVAVGWTVFGTLVATALSTLWDKSPSTLPPIRNVLMADHGHSHTYDDNDESGL
jgi:SNF family Na+-dependent transporter